MTLTIRKALRPELDAAIEWAAAEGWNPGIDDADPFWSADPDGYLVAEKDGILAGAVSLVRYGDDYAFLGFFLAHPDYRGQGIGLALWQAAMARAGAATVGLDGVVAQQENYRKSGFAYAHANARYGGTVSAGDPGDMRLVEVSPVHVPALVAYDGKFNPAPREAFMGAWLRQSDNRRSVALIEDAQVTGFATVRACRQGHKIGPLFADTEMGADLLFRKAAAMAGEGPVYLDVPEPNADAKRLCQRYNLTPVFETARMYRGPMPDLPLERIFGITTFELG